MGSNHATPSSSETGALQSLLSSGPGYRSWLYLPFFLNSLPRSPGPLSRSHSMANNFAAFFETLVAGADEYNKAKVGRTAPA